MKAVVNTYHSIYVETVGQNLEVCALPPPCGSKA